MPSAATPKVSLILAVYNLDVFLPACLDSLLAQTFHDFEIIAVDDGSTDGSADTLVRYTNKTGKLRVVTQKNQGPAGAFNTGMQLAQGQYVGFVGNDDWVAPDFLEKMVNALESNDSDVAVCNYFNCYESGEKIPAAFPENHAAETGREWLGFLCHARDFAPAVQRIIVRRALLTLNKISFPTVRNAEDQHLASLVYASASRVVAVPEPLVFYRIRHDSLSHLKNEKNLSLLALAQIRFGCDVQAFMSKGLGLAECYPDLRWKIADSLLSVDNNLKSVRDPELRKAIFNSMRDSDYPKLMMANAMDARQKRKAVKRILKYYWRILFGAAN